MPNYFANPAGQPQHVPQTANPLTVKDFEPIRRKTNKLAQFHGNMVHYKRWAERVTDHLAKGRKKYRELLKTAAKHPGPLLKATLWVWNRSGVPALELPRHLRASSWNALGRNSTIVEPNGAAGIGEEGNGFEI